MYLVVGLSFYTSKENHCRNTVLVADIEHRYVLNVTPLR